MIIMDLLKECNLDNCLFRGQWEISKDMLSFYSGIEKVDIKAFAVKQMIGQLSDKILNENKSAIVEEDKGPDIEFIEFGCKLLVLEIEQFKKLVETTIQIMPDYKIREIKNKI